MPITTVGEMIDALQEHDRKLALTSRRPAGPRDRAHHRRVLIWAGHNADTGAEPAGVVYFGRRHN